MSNSLPQGWQECLYLNVHLPHEQVAAAVAFVFGVEECCVAYQGSSVWRIPFSARILLSFDDLLEDFPLLVEIELLETALIPANQLATLARVCETLGCQALLQDHSAMSLFAYRDYILINRLPRCQCVTLDGNLLTQGSLHIVEYGALL